MKKHVTFSRTFYFRVFPNPATSQETNNRKMGCCLPKACVGTRQKENPYSTMVELSPPPAVPQVQEVPSKCFVHLNNPTSAAVETMKLGACPHEVCSDCARVWVENQVTARMSEVRCLDGCHTLNFKDIGVLVNRGAVRPDLQQIFSSTLSQEAQRIGTETSLENVLSSVQTKRVQCGFPTYL